MNREPEKSAGQILAEKIGADKAREAARGLIVEHNGIQHQGSRLSLQPATQFRHLGSQLQRPQL